jgi:hypothetical protein
MTLQELLDNAHLEALGMLEEKEQAAFDAAFETAPPGIQAQIRMEQARWAPMEMLLPKVEPPTELRDRVLDAVSAAIVSTSAGDGGLALASARRVSPLWRSASIGLMTAAAILAAAFVNLRAEFVHINALQNTSDSLQGLGTTFRSQYMNDVLFSPETVRSVFAAADPGFSGEASLWYNEEKWDHSRLYCKLPQLAGEASRYRVVIVDASDRVVEQIDEFQVNGAQPISRELPPMRPGMRVAIVSAQVGIKTPATASLLLVAQL